MVLMVQETICMKQYLKCFSVQLFQTQHPHCYTNSLTHPPTDSFIPFKIPYFFSSFIPHLSLVPIQVCHALTANLGLADPDAAAMAATARDSEPMAPGTQALWPGSTPATPSLPTLGGSHRQESNGRTSSPVWTNGTAPVVMQAPQPPSRPARRTPGWVCGR